VSQQAVGLVGLGVMGASLARNMARHGIRVVAYEQSADRSEQFIRAHGSEGELSTVPSPVDLVSALAPPRRVFVMVPAGAPVDAVIGALAPALAPGDSIADGGNSHYTDTIRRGAALEEQGILFLGVGVSGGERGALIGASLMPGGDPQAYELWRPVLEAIAARSSGGLCVTHVGTGGAGHFVKMVHNGLEYADMQLIAEAFDLLHRGLGYDYDKIAGILTDWNTRELESYLVGITARILRFPDTQGKYERLLDAVLDTAGQKGTGRWTTEAALALGVPVPTITAAVDARYLSAGKQARVFAEHAYARTPPAHTSVTPEDVEQALWAAKVCTYAQGFALIDVASAECGFGVRPAELARIWKAGCIIRARFLDRVQAACSSGRDLPNLLVSGEFRGEMAARLAALRNTVAAAALTGIPAPAMSASLSYFDAYTTGRLPANLIQAQRDYFGAHTYERVDTDGVFHTDWEAEPSA